MPTADGRPRVVLGVAGGIAAYKSAELLRLLTESGHAVRVVPTRAALEFVGAATWAALSGEPVATDVFEGVEDVPHVAVGRSADILVVAPATADLLARAAAGRADDLLTATLLTARCPIVFAPAMHTEMWDHPATRANVAVLRARGALVLDPAVGRLTGADSGRGRLPEPAALFDVVRRVLARGRLPADLAGRHVVVSAGGTREPLDPVRFLGNRSSGRQGWALATTAVARGASVTLVAANVSLLPPAGASVVAVGTAEELGAAVAAEAAAADAIVMAAAVADFRPARPSTIKIKKGAGEPTSLDLVRTSDVLAGLVSARRPGQVVVGFAAETDDVLDNGRAKLLAKGADLMVVNPVGERRGFESPENEGVILAADGAEIVVPLGSKEALADAVWDAVVARLGHGGAAR
ncbi:MAG: phosphopantothenoylcysteine decarboxylase / phosphopantothenate---cysteine ligase [Frankiaceae bacterium]|nr:phosphopantothenoylcysteine decarboxylase / phosphopantothenate---cysteine ligase [Frankiaceae bacterium]